MTAVLEVSGLHAGYAGVPAVRGVDLTVAEGEVVALLGANGAGKTTTLLALAGVLPLLDGEVRLLGRSIRGRRPHDLVRRGLAFVPEERGLFSTLTVAENLRLARRGRTSQPRELLSLFPALQPLVDRRVGLLSGGEQQMLALAKAFALEPRLLMVDELSLGLAPRIVEHLLEVVRTMAHERGIAVLLVEQHVHMALEVADRVYVLRRGELDFHGARADLAGNTHLLESSYLGGAQA